MEIKIIKSEQHKAFLEKIHAIFHAKRIAPEGEELDLLVLTLLRDLNKLKSPNKLYFSLFSRDGNF